ncbi:MAG: diguanylate cyclase [Alteromonadaceae bacterium]|nr:MAG: diguanylate cyclase [Alteromonadaceae bacterium]
MKSCFFLNGIAIIITWLIATAAIAAQITVRVDSRGDANAVYALEMIRLALDKTGGDYEISINDAEVSALRMRMQTLEGKTDVFWTATSTDLEEEFLPVRVPLYKGLLGYRIFIIHKDNKNLFSNVKTFKDLDAFSFGQGRGWTDTTIMEANGLKVTQVTKYHGLFYMADGKRFDAFPRGVNEPWTEIKSRPDLDLTVDENLMFVYKMPYYLLVSPNRKSLAKRLDRGLKIAISDGSFDEIFFNNETVKLVAEKAKLSGRKIFNLDNPDLPPNTPLTDESLWFNVAM